MKRGRGVLGGLLAAAVVLAVCLAKRHGSTTVLHIGFPCDSYWDVPGEDTYGFMDAAIAQFEEEHPGVRVEYTSGIRTEDYSEWLAGRFLEGTEPDVMVILPEDFTLYSEREALRELNACMKRDGIAAGDFYTAAIAAGTSGGRQYALPMECVPQMMFVNKTLLQNEGIELPQEDWTWSDFYSLCAALTRDTDGDGSPDQFGVYGYGWREAMVANGCTLFREDGTGCLLNQFDQQEAVKFAQELDLLNEGVEVSDKMFDEGRVAFRPMFFSEYRSYEPYPWRIRRSTSFEWDCIPMPRGDGEKAGNDSQVSTLLLGISRRSTKAELAWELLKTIACTQESQLRVYTELRGASALRSITESDEVAELLQKDSPSASSAGFGTLPLTLEHGVAATHFARYETAMEQADSLITEAIRADKNLELQLLEIQRKLQQVLME